MRGYRHAAAVLRRQPDPGRWRWALSGVSLQQLGRTAEWLAARAGSVLSTPFVLRQAIWIPGVKEVHARRAALNYRLETFSRS